MRLLSLTSAQYFAVAAAYTVLCWVALDVVPFLNLSPGAFFLVLILTFIGGGGIGIAQLGDTREPIHTLSGKTFLYPDVPEDAQSKTDKMRVSVAKIIFFIVAMYVETYWLKLLSEGKFDDPAWSAGRALEIAIHYYYILAASGDAMSGSLDLNNIYFLIGGFPAVYAGFMYWVLHTRKRS